MKTIIFAALIATIAFSGCKKDNTSPSNTADISINGVKTNFTLMKYLDVSSTYNISNYGAEVNSNTIEIVFVNPVIGDLDFNYNNHIEIIIGDIDYVSKNGSGKISITKMSGTSISGTFSGTFTTNNTEIVISGNYTAEQIVQTL